MRAQLKESKGLRSTRTTARHREVPEDGTSNVSVPESLRKTHLTVAGQTQCPPPCRQYTRTGPEIPSHCNLACIIIFHMFTLPSKRRECRKSAA